MFGTTGALAVMVVPPNVAVLTHIWRWVYASHIKKLKP